MRQSSSTSSSSSIAQGLNPVLQAALDSLDVELEEELIRYRRQKHRQSRAVGQKSSLAWDVSRRPLSSANRAIELPTVQSSLSSSASSSPSLSSSASSLPPLLTSSPEQTANKAQSLPPLQPSTRSAGSPPASVKTRLNSAPLAAVAPAEAVDPTEETTFLAIASQAAAEQLSQAAEASENRSNYAEDPQDYLESSEELLRSIAEESTNLRSEPESSLLDTLLTPLGIGSMLLLLLSSSTLGYVIMNPGSLDRLTAQDQPRGEASSLEAMSQPGARSAPVVPDLAADEFVDLNADSLSTLPRSSYRSQSPSQSSPAASPSPSSTAQPGANSAASSALSDLPDPGLAAAPEVQPPPYVEPEPAANTYSFEESPEPPVAVEPAAPPPEVAPALPPESAALPDETPATSSTTSAVASSAPTGNYYYVVTPYSGDPSLEQAREAVPDAYVRNFSAGASVQLGAFSDPEKANELIQQLEDQGIPAEVYQP